MEATPIMILREAFITNFGSYDELQFDYGHLGLSLISGVTGSGKSTLFDIPMWILFGKTAKDVSSDDVKSWKNPSEDTVGIIQIELSDKSIKIHRVRGKVNDLYWIENDSEFQNRGKDITETQQLINSLLGIDHDLYTTIFYFHEFSPTSTFFIDKPKTRRELFEKLTNLKIPLLLLEKCAFTKKQLKKDSIEKSQKSQLEASKINQLKEHLETLTRYSTTWDLERKNKIHELTLKNNNFHKEKEEKISVLLTKNDNYLLQKNSKILKIMDKISQLSKKVHDLKDIGQNILLLKHELDHYEKTEKCSECGNPKNFSSYSNLVSDINKLTLKEQKFKEYCSQLNRLEDEKSLIEREPNPYENLIDICVDQLNMYEIELNNVLLQKNPYFTQIELVGKKVTKLTDEYTELTNSIVKTQNDINLISLLTDLIINMKSHLLHNSVRDIRELCNRYLSDYFDAELLVDLNIKDDDTLEVLVTKNGYSCSYKQLSKGQRRLLRLVFSIAVMKVSANNFSINNENLFFDEALDGLDSNFKIKAFDLFTELELAHTSVLLVDHADEFKTLFSNRFNVIFIRR
jgi:DNA repair exonuclease SbcCD ATPase subunit